MHLKCTAQNPCNHHSDLNTEHFQRPRRHPRARGYQWYSFLHFSGNKSEREWSLPEDMTFPCFLLALLCLVGLRCPVNGTRGWRLLRGLFLAKSFRNLADFDPDIYPLKSVLGLHSNDRWEHYGLEKWNKLPKFRQLINSGAWKILVPPPGIEPRAPRNESMES